uniref:Uncharacterized protein n=1 Tax=Scophthalmus maximus TaxID=52904 RepID=A0A8D2ZS54_SCOMX
YFPEPHFKLLTKCKVLKVITTVEQILTSNSAGMIVIKEYEETGSLKDSTRRLMVNIIVAHLKETKEFHALGIVSLFPSLKDPYSEKRYVSFLLATTASRFLEKWNTKDNVLQETRALKETPLLKKLLTTALNEGSDPADQPASNNKLSKQIYTVCR